ncbi:MAG: ferritin [Clostridium sp.]
MINNKLLERLNRQLNYEFYSSHVYLATAGYCSSQDLPGFANFFQVQAEEEKFHAMKIFNYINEMGGKVELTSINAPVNDFESILDAFKDALSHERIVTKKIYELMDVALDEREHATISFLKWFIDEQVEEEASFTNIVKRLERIKDDANALYVLDDELAKRVFTLPAAV